MSACNHSQFMQKVCRDNGFSIKSRGLDIPFLQTEIKETKLVHIKVKPRDLTEARWFLVFSYLTNMFYLVHRCKIPKFHKRRARLKSVSLALIKEKALIETENPALIFDYLMKRKIEDKEWYN